MANQIVEVIDLKTHRERKADQRRDVEAADAFADNLHFGHTPLSFAMPVAFLVFWPTWVFAPLLTSASNKDGSGIT